MRRFFLIFLFFSVTLSFAQNRLFEKGQFPAKKTYDASIIDSTYGITLFEKLNPMTGGDSIRNCNGYACNGWVEDFYTNGQILHKGFYQNGQVKNYKNFYPNGQPERIFKPVDDYRSSVKVFYSNGILKSEVDYDEGNPLRWVDYYPNGKMEFIEQYNKKGEYFLQRRTFFENGNPETILELTNPKKKIYSSKAYFGSGKIKEEGEVVYNSDMLDYQKNGIWKIYTEDGKLKTEQTFLFGKVNGEKAY